MPRLFCAAALVATALANPVMEAISSAFHHVAANPPATFRETFGRVLEQLDIHAHKIWDAATPEEQAAAKARAVAPPSPTPFPNPLPGPYWRWIPEYLGNALPNGTPLTFASSCYAKNTAVGAFSKDGKTYDVVLTSENPTSASCQDLYWFATVEWMDFKSVNASRDGPVAVSNFSFPVTARKYARKWVQRKGAVAMRFIDSDPLTVVWEIIASISLFVPALTTTPPPPDAAKRNIDFLKDYVNITMLPRPKETQNVTLDESLFQSGDIVFVHRPDGLATLEQWGTGATTSHTVTFMRSEWTNELFIVESQSAGVDWPIDDIQMNPWSKWQEMAAHAGYGYVWMPMAAAARARFNVTAAWEYVNSTVGFNYGFQDFVGTFYDTEFDNLPWPARPEELEVLLGVLEGLTGDLIKIEGTPWLNILFTQGLLQHLGQPLSAFNASILAAFEIAAQQGLSVGQAFAIVEQDTNIYPERTGRGNTTTGVGPSLVCNAYACEIHKHAGSFGPVGADINCADTQNRDVYQMTLFDSAPVRPQACVDADPDNVNCQLAGPYTINLWGVGTWEPYAHMAEHCPSLPVAYTRTPGC